MYIFIYSTYFHPKGKGFAFGRYIYFANILWELLAACLLNGKENISAATANTSYVANINVICVVIIMLPILPLTKKNNNDVFAFAAHIWAKKPPVLLHIL